MDVTLQNIFLLISENQLVKDQRKYRTCSRNFISYQVCYFTVDTVISFSLWPFFFFWTVVCCGIWSWNAWLTNNITAFLWRIINEGSTVLLMLEKIIYQVMLIFMLCQKEIDRRKSLYFFIMMCHPLQDVMWCFS